MLFLKKLFRDDKIICKNFERHLINFGVKFREKFDKILLKFADNFGIFEEF